MPRSALVAWAMIVVLLAVMLVLIPGYGSRMGILSLLVIAAFLGIASIGQTLAIVLGGIDLSIPAVIGMANVLAVRWYGAGLPFLIVVMAVLALGAAIGAVNGLLARRIGAHPLLITLASGFVILGAVLIYTEGETVGTAPDYLLMAVSPAGRSGPIPVPPIVLLWALAAVAVVLFERFTVAGRWIFATGSNERAAEFALIPVTAVWMMAFGASGFFAAATGILLAGFSGGADAGVGAPYLFQTVAAVVVGGTALTGGAGGYARTVAGAILITQITTLLIGMGYDERLQQIVLGILIVALVAIYGREAHVRDEV